VRFFARGAYNELMENTTSEVIILHGWSRDSSPSAKWQPIKQQLQNVGIKGSVLRLPGFEFPLTESWGVDEYVAWLARQFVGKKKITLVGHSFGGHLAVTYAARFPSQVEKLVLIASAGMRSQSLTSWLKRNFFYYLAKFGKKLTTSNLLRRVIYRLAGEQDYLKANPIMRESMRRVLEHEVDVLLPSITADTTIIWGANDETTPLEFVARLQQGIPTARLRLIPNARHGVPFTHPKQVGRYIIEAHNG